MLAWLGHCGNKRGIISFGPERKQPNSYITAALYYWRRNGRNNSLAINRIDLMFRAFSDHTRLRILSLLQDGECCVGDLVDILQIEQPGISRHLAYLRRSSLVAVRKARQWSYYSLAPARGEFHRKLLECLACCFDEVPQVQADRARAAEVRKTGGAARGAQHVPRQSERIPKTEPWVKQLNNYVWTVG